ncbi:NAD(P)H-binding protein [Ottowia testudinis]|uniref:NAD(P)H-binding protein n=1 Tax=Ottowia testudinis TaxID=2816950 RepID=A0A975CK26_9BURK|nr:NAD(P)H-binding protein [Ottowia testudinis]QTD46511.1 NAD(P)H-binding protein [Ottowia testudinis]
MAADGPSRAISSAAHRVLLAGATGLIGRELLQALLADPRVAVVNSLGRRPLGALHPKLTHHVVDFAALPVLPPVDEAYVALGTTIKQAGSQAAFRAVDFDAVVNTARAAHAAGASRLGIVSAMGADPASRVFYNRVKGEMEQAVRAVGITATVFARPSLLEGDRSTLQQPPRAGERWLQAAMRVLRPVTPANLRAIAARDVALGLIDATRAQGPGVQVLLSGALQRR